MSVSFHEIENCWNYYLSIEENLNETSRYIEPTGQENVYSFEFQKVIMLCGAEIESVFKLICSAVDENHSCGNISEYKKIMLRAFPKIGETRVIVPRWGGKNIFPFGRWTEGPLGWWSAYTEVKHNRISKFSNATYKNAVYCLAALYVLILYLYRINGYDCKGDDSRYFCSDYYPIPFYAQRPSELPDFCDVESEEVMP